MEEYDTLKYYDDNAKLYVEQTKYGDMREAYNKFLKYVKDKGHILDFGCGSGRDSKYFLEHGYYVTAIDGSKEMCKLASLYINREVKCMKFEELEDVDMYDGIWACSSILHVEREKLINVLRKMIVALKEDGIIYTCFKLGDNFEIKEGKYYNYMRKELVEDLLNQIEIRTKIIEYYESTTVNNINRPSASWGNYLIKRIK